MIHNLRYISPLGFQFSEFLRGTEEELCYCALILCKNILQLFLWRSRYLKSPIIRKNILWKKPMNSFSTILFTYRKIKWYFESQNWQKMHFQKQVSKVAIGPKVPSIVIFYEKIHVNKKYGTHTQSLEILHSYNASANTWTRQCKQSFKVSFTLQKIHILWVGSAIASLASPAATVLWIGYILGQKDKGVIFLEKGKISQNKQNVVFLVIF